MWFMAVVNGLFVKVLSLFSIFILAGWHYSFFFIILTDIFLLLISFYLHYEKESEHSGFFLCVSWFELVILGEIADKLCRSLEFVGSAFGLVILWKYMAHSIWDLFRCVTLIASGREVAARKAIMSIMCSNLKRGFFITQNSVTS